MKGYTLAYHVRTALENGAAETRHTDFLIDANNGSILKSWDALETAAASGTGKSQFSGTVTINTNSVTSGWEMRDVARSMNYATYNLNHGTSGTGTIYTDADNTWGEAPTNLGWLHHRRQRPDRRGRRPLRHRQDARLLPQRARP